MKYLKTFEIAENKPQIGDYVICKTNYRASRIDKWIINEIGQIIDYGYSGSTPELILIFKDTYKCKYENIPYDVNLNYFNNNSTKTMRISEIIEFSPNKKDLEIRLQANKYNL